MRLRWFRARSFLVLSLLLLGSARLLTAQDDIPHVVFIEEPQELRMSSVTDPGPDGLTRLADMFRAEGALVEWIRLRDTIPEDVDVIVLVRPRVPLSAENLARIWMRVGAGASLLVAVDPSGFLGGNTEAQNGGLSTLMTLDQGVTLLNGIAIEPWYVNETLTDLRAALSMAVPDSVPHPVIEPLQQYDLPLTLWGARPLRVEPFGVDSLAWSLAVAEPKYFEATTAVYPRADTVPAALEVHIGTDPQGRLSIGAIGENTRTGSRVAVLGDAELLQNGFGLALNGISAPQYPGSYVLAERLIAWMLRKETYPDLPPGILWLAVDGQGDDWATEAGTLADDEGDTTIFSLDITQMRGIRTDAYAYILLETAQPASPDSAVDLEFDSSRDGQPDLTLTFNASGVVARPPEGEPVVIHDAAFAVGTVVELRVPLRLVNPVTSISQICLYSSIELAFPQEPDCVQGQFPIRLSTNTDAVPLRVDFGTPLATVTTDGVNRANIRSSPDTSGSGIGALDINEIVAVVGRNETGEWYYVQTAAAQGWVNALALTFIGDLEQIPVRAS